MLTRVVWVSSQHARTMVQQCRLLQALEHQAECFFRYFRENEGIFRIVFNIVKINKSGLIISFGVGMLVRKWGYRAVSYLLNLKFDMWCVARACNFTKINTPPWMLFKFFKLYKWYQIAHRITYSIWQCSVIKDNNGIYEISKRGPCCWDKWVILPQFCTSSSVAGMPLSLKFCV